MTRDMHEDCRFWDLTRVQCAHHHARLADMHARRTRKIAQRTVAFTTRSNRVLWTLLVTIVGLAILNILF